LFNLKEIIKTIGDIGPNINPMIYGAAIYIVILIILILYYFLLYLSKKI